MLKKLLIIITLCTTLTLHATPGATGEPIDVTSLYDIVYEYDKLNRVTKATYASGESIGYSYDAGGNLLGVVFEGRTLSPSEDYIQNITINKNTTVAVKLRDADGYAIKVQLQHGQFGDGVMPNMTYVPNRNYVGEDKFVFQVNTFVNSVLVSSLDIVNITIKDIDTDGDKIYDEVDLDDDNDGISDLDEEKYGLDPLNPNDATLDSDGDGYVNIVEIEAGTKPNDKNETPNKLDSVVIQKIGEYADKEYISLETEDGYAYVLSNSAIQIFNVKNENNIQEVSKLLLDGAKYRIVKNANYLYIANGDEGLRIIDISDRTKPEIIGTYISGHIQDVKIQGNKAYLSCNGGGALNIVDITDKTTPRLVAKYGDAGMSIVDAKGKYIYADNFGGSRGISILELKDKEIILVGKYNESSPSAFIEDIEVQANYAYVIVKEKGVRIISIEDKYSPILINTVQVDNALKLEVYGQYLFVTTSGSDGIKVIDVSNIDKPKVLGKFHPYKLAKEMKIEDNKLYIVGGAEGLKIFTTTPKLFGAGNVTLDSDGDGYNDDVDTFPNDPNEWIDTNGDGIGNNADTDDDGDGISDANEIKYGLNSLDPSDANEDADGDGVSNIDEINAGTDINTNEAIIRIKALDDIVSVVNAEIEAIVIEASVSNGSPAVLSVESNNADIAVATLDSNMLTLTAVENAQGTVEITIIATLGDKYKIESFTLEIQENLEEKDNNDSVVENESKKGSGGGAIGYLLPLFALLALWFRRRRLE